MKNAPRSHAVSTRKVGAQDVCGEEHQWDSCFGGMLMEHAVSKML